MGIWFEPSITKNGERNIRQKLNISVLNAYPSSHDSYPSHEPRNASRHFDSQVEDELNRLYLHVKGHHIQKSTFWEWNKEEPLITEPTKWSGS